MSYNSETWHSAQEFCTALLNENSGFPASFLELIKETNNTREFDEIFCVLRNVYKQNTTFTQAAQCPKCILMVKAVDDLEYELKLVTNKHDSLRRNGEQKIQSLNKRIRNFEASATKERHRRTELRKEIVGYRNQISLQEFSSDSKCQRNSRNLVSPELRNILEENRKLIAKLQESLEANDEKDRLVSRLLEESEGRRQLASTMRSPLYVRSCRDLERPSSRWSGFNSIGSQRNRREVIPSYPAVVNTFDYSAAVDRGDRGAVFGRKKLSSAISIDTTTTAGSRRHSILSVEDCLKNAQPENSVQQMATKFI